MRRIIELMRPTRFTSLLIVSILALTLAACGGGSPAAPKGDDGNGGQSTAASAEASADKGDPGSSQDSGKGSGDVEGVAAALVPPNSTEVGKTTAAGIVIAVYESTDSIDSLKSFYESAIAGTGLTILATTEASGGVSWVISDADASGLGGAVAIVPSSDTPGGTTVSVTVGDSGY